MLESTVGSDDGFSSLSTGRQHGRLMPSCVGGKLGVRWRVQQLLVIVFVGECGSREGDGVGERGA